MRRLARQTQATVVSVDYRLAPENPFPAAVEDALEALHWTISHASELASRGAHLYVAGDSAGGNLAAVVSQVMKERNESGISGVILIYPCLDGDIDAPALQRFEPPFLTRSQLSWFFDQYLPDRDRRSDPRFAPLLRADLAGLPPTLIITAEYDLLKDEADRYALRLRAAGCQATTICYPGMIHGFFALGDLQEAEKVRSDIAGFVAGTRVDNGYQETMADQEH